MNGTLTPNAGKNLTIDTSKGVFERIPVKTHVIMKEDVMEAVLDKYIAPHLQNDDIVFISEKIVAITQGRAFLVKDIKVSRLAKFMVRFVYKSDYGIGIGSPETMELCIREVGRIRLLFAAFCSAVGKLFGKRGVFYNILGMKARAIDGPCEYTIPPYNNYAKLAPKNPNQEAKRLANHIGHEVVIIDANDIGVNVLGKSSNAVSDEFAIEVFKDNPLGQSAEQTPLCIVRLHNEQVQETAQAPDQE